MESLSRPPHRRRHSRNPYDDVFMSSGAERETLEAHEYAEIFSGSSSIPVLDLSGLDERVGSVLSRASKLDYSNIFGGGFRNEDAGLPCEELFSGSAKKPQSQNLRDERVLSQESDSLHSAGNSTDERVFSQESDSLHSARKSTDERILSQESDPLHSAGKPKLPSGESSDHSTDEPKKQFNVSFNRTHQKNIDASNRKTHVAQLQAVPGFTHFVDGTPRPPKTDNGRTANSLKREVSRTWSFNAEAETIKGKSGLSREKSHIADNKSQPRASYFVPKTDASEKNASEFPPPFYGEDFDENSIAAASAAALKRAIDQAQESIRLAKMIMERKKEGYQNGSKARQRRHPKVSNREGEMDSDSKKNNFKDKNAELDPTTFDSGKPTPSLIHNDAFISAAKIEVECVCENAAEDKGHVPVLSGDGDLFSSNGIQRESHYIDEKIELKRTEENVEAVEAPSGGADFPVLLANECKTANLEQTDVSVDHAQGPEVVAEQVERALDTSSQRIQELEMNVEEAGDCKATFDHGEGPEYKVERVPNTAQRTRRQWKVLGGACEFFGIGQEDRLSEDSENDMDDKGKKEPEEVINVECITELRSESDSITNELGGNEALGQVETEREPEWKENGYIFKTYDDKANLWFESEEQLTEALEKESEQLAYDRNVILETEEGGKRVDEAHEPEIDDQPENAHDEDEQNLPREVDHSEVEERHMNTSECEAPDTIETGEKHCAQFQKSAAFFDIEENRNNCQNEDDAYEDHINKAVDVNSSSSSTIFSETREACNVDLDNSPKECQTVVENHKENYTVPDVIEKYSEISKDKEAEHLFHQAEDNEIPRTVPDVIEKYSEISKDKEAEHLFHQAEDNEIPRTETLRRISSEKIFFESELHNDFDSVSSDGSKIENVHVMGEDPEEELPEDEGASNTSEIHDVAKDFMSKIDLPHVHASDIRTSEFDPDDVEQVSEEASGSDEGSVSTSSHENINGFSVHDSEECEENANDMTPINDELKDEVDLVSNERKLAEEKLMESEGAGERDPNTENNKGDLAGTSPVEDKDAKVGDQQNSDKNDSQQRIDAIKRGREREKDRKVVERAIREARERAFAEARERAERAAVEKASAEARQRAMSQAREKASNVKQPIGVDKASIQAKLRAERAAVERATAEARERALEKAMSLKTTHTEGRTPEMVSGSSRSNGLKHSFSSSDLDNVTESAQRRKARVERHQRIMERAAKALAEKNMRDVLAQKEQAERNRLAESLDADIKRWATGKEKNLRALLSTLQYILGADSGWQPIPLTDIVTTAAVKKAYRKATLCVHPDKLQQRGATIKQKYICEKVFDLLKAAWSRYDSDER